MEVTCKLYSLAFPHMLMFSTCLRGKQCSFLLTRVIPLSVIHVYILEMSVFGLSVAYQVFHLIYLDQQKLLVYMQLL